MVKIEDVFIITGQNNYSTRIDGELCENKRYLGFIIDEGGLGEFLCCRSRED
jgi:hypothetical protein